MAVAPPEIHVPYTHVQEGTYLYLTQQVEPERVHFHHVVGDDWAYTDYLQAQWDKRDAFINMEHDIVPWPGAFDALQVCPEFWCFFGYQAGVDVASCGAAQFGLVRFSHFLIKALPHVWTQMRTDHGATTRPWAYNDIHFFDYATRRGFRPHQHFPAVLNAQMPTPNEVDMDKMLKRPPE